MSETEKNIEIDSLKQSLAEKKFENEKLKYQIELNFEKIRELSDQVNLIQSNHDKILEESYLLLEDSNQKMFLVEEKDRQLLELRNEISQKEKILSDLGKELERLQIEKENRITRKKYSNLKTK